MLSPGNNITQLQCSVGTFVSCRRHFTGKNFNSKSFNCGNYFIKQCKKLL